MAILGGLSIFGCGGGGGGGDANSPSSALPVATAITNAIPRLEGSPPLAVTSGLRYSFIPLGFDADGDDLHYRVFNLPGWASFDADTGRIHGRPGYDDVGTYPDIEIQVSDGRDFMALEPFKIEVLGTASGRFTISWLPPMSKADGSELGNLAGYRVGLGTQSRHYSNWFDLTNPGATVFFIDNLPSGTYFVTVTAYDTFGNESVDSWEVSATIKAL